MGGRTDVFAGGGHCCVEGAGLAGVRLDALEKWWFILKWHKKGNAIEVTASD